MKVFAVDLYDYFKVEKPNGARANLKCYLPDNTVEINPDRRHPAMLVIPGGGYGMVSDREAEPIALAFLNKGFSCFVLTYSVAPIRFPYQIAEAVMAMNYIRKNADELEIAPEKIASVGFSAGGHLCAMLGSYYNAEEIKTVFSGEVSARPNAVILSYPVINYPTKGHIGSFDNLCGEDDELKYKLDISNLVDENSSPAFIWATYEDGVVPVSNALEVARAYDKVGVPFSVHIWGKGAHGLSVSNKTVYGKVGQDTMLAQATKSVNTWVDLATEWLEEMGISIQD